MSAEFVNAVAVAVFGGIFIASITGVILMYRQVGQLHEAIKNLTEALSAMEIRSNNNRRETRDDIDRIHLRIDDLVKRPS